MRRIVSILVLFFLWIGVPRAGESPYWVFFTDRGGIDVDEAAAAKRWAVDEPKQSSRRARVLSPEQLFDEYDLPVNPAYIEQVTDAGGEIRNVSRYLNGISAFLDEGEREVVHALPFVRSIQPVRTLRRPAEPDEAPAPKTGAAGEAELLPYGDSFDQANLVGVPGLHELGYLGGGIRIAVLDSGFDGLGHTAFDSLQVSHTRDFVDGDDDPEGDGHGTQVLSVMAALDHGYMIGTAPQATYALARTEIRDGETRVEEDNWVAAVEWADSLGVDVINSSLGYVDFDDGFAYTYEQLDGQTAVTTIAANIAVLKGIMVVTSAGNEGTSSWHYVTTPADGFDVIAVGGVDREGVIVPTSSRGPTFDGRIKPDFVALGQNVQVVNTGTVSSYIQRSGTSYASPAVAGAVALILEANMDWGPVQAKQEMIANASRSDNPDTVEYAYGYGTIDALAASGVVVPEPPVARFTVYNPYPQPVRFRDVSDQVYFPMDVPEEGRVLSISIFNFGGDLVNRLEGPVIGSGELRDRGDAPSWNGTNFTGDDVAPGIYFFSIELSGYGIHRGKLAVIR